MRQQRPVRNLDFHHFVLAGWHVKLNVVHRAPCCDLFVCTLNTKFCQLGIENSTPAERRQHGPDVKPVVAGTDVDPIRRRQR